MLSDTNGDEYILGQDSCHDSLQGLQRGTSAVPYIPYRRLAFRICSVAVLVVSAGFAAIDRSSSCTAQTMLGSKVMDFA
jgi:hypothetical protein